MTYKSNNETLNGNEMIDIRCNRKKFVKIELFMSVDFFQKIV